MSPATGSRMEVMDRRYTRADPVNRERMVLDLATELGRLMGLSLSNKLPGSDLDYPSLVDRLADALGSAVHEPDYPYPLDETLDLIRSLASDRSRPIHSLIDDLAEILSVPRTERSEYLTNTHRAPPWKISKLMLEYAVFARRLDDLLGQLTKGFCATNCDRLPEGCCTVLGYDLGLVPDRMLELQELEAHRMGWARPGPGMTCKFHGPTGCSLVLFKSPACIGMLCEPLEAHLQASHPKEAVETLLCHLARFRNCDIDRARVFESMESTWRAGLEIGDDSQE